MHCISTISANRECRYCISWEINIIFPQGQSARGPTPQCFRALSPFSPAYLISYLWILKFFSMPFDEAFGLPVANNPVQEVKRVLLVDGVSGDAQPVNDHWHGREDDTGGDREVEVGAEGKDWAAHSCPENWEIPASTEGPVEVSCDARVNGFVKIDLMLVDFSDFLLALENLEGEQFCVVVLGIWESLWVSAGVQADRAECAAVGRCAHRSGAGTSRSAFSPQHPSGKRLGISIGPLRIRSANLPSIKLYTTQVIILSMLNAFPFIWESD